MRVKILVAAGLLLGEQKIGGTANPHLQRRRDLDLHGFLHPAVVVPRSGGLAYHLQAAETGAIGAAARAGQVGLRVQCRECSLDPPPIGRIDGNRYVNVLGDTQVPMQLQGHAAYQDEAHIVLRERFDQYCVLRLDPHAHAAARLCPASSSDQ
jgi:hypothetical protein